MLMILYIKIPFSIKLTADKLLYALGRDCLVIDQLAQKNQDGDGCHVELRWMGVKVERY